MQVIINLLNITAIMAVVEVLNITELIDFKTLSKAKELPVDTVHTLSGLSLNALKQWNTDALQESCKSAAVWCSPGNTSMMQPYRFAGKKGLSIHPADTFQGITEPLQVYLSVAASRPLCECNVRAKFWITLRFSTPKGILKIMVIKGGFCFQSCTIISWAWATIPLLTVVV